MGTATDWNSTIYTRNLNPGDATVSITFYTGDGKFLYASTWGRLLPDEVVVRVPTGVYYVRLVGYAGAWRGDVPYRLLVERVQ